MAGDDSGQEPEPGGASGDAQELRSRVQDLTRRLAESEELAEGLRRQYEELQDLYNRAPCGYHSLDKTGLFVRMNDTELGWLGYTREEILTKRFPEIITEKGLETFRKKFPTFMERGAVHNLEFELIRKDGTIMPVLLSSVAIKDEAGNFVMSRSTIFDLAERKKIEHATELRALFDAIPDAVLHVGADGIINGVKTAPGMESLIPAAGCVGRPVRDVLPAELADEIIRAAPSVIATREPQSVEYEHNVGGEARAYEARIVAHRDEALIIVRDVTERRVAEEVRTRASLQEELIRAQSRALAELSSPLLTISDNVVVMPLIGAVDERRSRHILESMLSGISTNRASVAILDITGLSTIDENVADALVRTARAANLLGAEVVLTGVQPAAAQTFTLLGTDLGSIVTRSTLQDGIAYALARGLGRRRAP